MIKKVVKILLSIVTVMLTMLCVFHHRVAADIGQIKVVPIGYAAKYDFDIPNIYSTNKRTHLHRKKGTQLYAIYLNGNIVFCVEPGVAVNDIDGNKYTGVKWSNELQRKIDLIIYYSYYNTAKTQDNLAQTILAVQKAANNGFDAEAHITGFNNWYNNELLPKLNDHNKHISFHQETYTVNVGDTLHLTDKNNTLSTSEIEDSYNGAVHINGNDLVISPNNDTKDVLNISLKRHHHIEQNGYNQFPKTLYISETRQNLYSFGAPDPVHSHVTIHVVKRGNIRITKRDSENKTVLSGVEFGVYEEGTDNLIQRGVTNENGIVEFNDLLVKAYDIREIRTRETYRLNKEVYHVNVEANQTKELVIDNDVKKMNISISKYLNKGLDNISTHIAGKDIVFNVISNTTNQLVDTFKTNEFGFGVSNWLRIDDTYRLEEVSLVGYAPLRPIQIQPTTEDNKTYHYIIENQVKKSYLKIQKIDANTKEIIKVSGVKFQLYKDGKVVKQVVNYPIRQEIDTFETNENGEVTLPEELVYGTYELKEITAPQGYYLSKETIKFEVDGKLDTIIVQFENIKSPMIHTLATTESGNKIGYANEKHIEKVILKDLEVGKMYKLVSTQYDSEGKMYTTQEKKFTAIANEQVEIFEFKVPIGYVGNIVYGEDLYKDNEKVAVHFDLSNKEQIVTVKRELPKTGEQEMNIITGIVFLLIGYFLVKFE